MYESGALIGFILGVFIFLIQGLKRKQESGESMGAVLMGVFIGSIFTAFLSWVSVIVLVLLLLTGKVWGISEKNL